MSSIGKIQTDGRTMSALGRRSFSFIKCTIFTIDVKKTFHVFLFLPYLRFCSLKKFSQRFLLFCKKSIENPIKNFERHFW